MNNVLNSQDLLSFDFLHDNHDNKIFFNSNYVYNLNTYEKFKIDEKYLIDNIYKNIEKYTNSLMIDNFIHEHNGCKYEYQNINEPSKIQYKKEYVLVFDNMQCDEKSIKNIKLLLNTENIHIYIPFIFCCENIRTNKKDNDKNNKDNNLKKSYDNIKNNLKNYSIIENNFFCKDGNLKNEFINYHL